MATTTEDGGERAIPGPDLRGPDFPARAAALASLRARTRAERLALGADDAGTAPGCGDEGTWTPGTAGGGSDG